MDESMQKSAPPKNNKGGLFNIDEDEDEDNGFFMGAAKK
jgi:hypothetical protein